jgi:hypothetical protein
VHYWTETIDEEDRQTPPRSVGVSAKTDNRIKKKNKHPSAAWTNDHLVRRALVQLERCGMVWNGMNGNGIIGNQTEEKGSEADGQIQSTRESKKATTQQSKNRQTATRLHSCHVTYSNNPPVRRNP